LEPGVAITAETDAAGNLAPVQHVLAKVKAALAERDGRGQPVIERVVVHPDNLGEARDAVEQIDPALAAKVRTAATLAEAAEALSGRAAGLLRYFEGVEAWPDRDQGGGYLAGRRRTEVYVEPDLLKLERRAQRIERERPGENERRARAAPEAALD